MGSYFLFSVEFFVCTLLVYPAHHERDGHKRIVSGKVEPGWALQDEIQVFGFDKEAEALGNKQARGEAEDDGKGYEKMHYD